MCQRLLVMWLFLGWLLITPNLQVFGQQADTPRQPLPADNQYVQVKEGHLSLDGKRVRYWTWIGHFWCDGENAQFNLKKDDSPEIRQAKVEKQRRIYDALAQRIKDLGFNMVRYWAAGRSWDPNYTIGDGSPADQTAFALAALDKRGIKVWFTGFNDLGELSVDAAKLVDDPATAQAWTEAFGELKTKGLRSARQVAWDARTSAATLKRMGSIADWPNKYKNDLRLADDPQIAVWELQNEEWWFSAMAGGAWQGLPKFFRDELHASWADFLKRKYADDDGLRRAWMFLLPGESIVAKTVLLAPIGSGGTGSKAVNDANPAALAVLAGSGKQRFTRDDFTRKRGEDVIEFLLQLQIKYKTHFRDEVKKWGKSLALCPLVLDTGNGYQIQAVQMQQQGDAMAMCSYLWGVATDPQQPRFPFVSGLEEQPRLAMGIPWVEVGRVPGKPFFVYEFQTSNPDKYRAEVPFRIATLGAIQDWDIIGWHLFGRPNDPDKPEPYAKSLSMNHAGKGGSIEGVHFKNDLVESAAMNTAGRIFVNGALDPVASPTVMTFGSKSLYDPRSTDYGQSFGDLGPKIAPTAYRYGLQMKIDPSVEADSVTGKTVERGVMEACPIRPTQQIEYDWQKGHLIQDAPSAVSYTGFFARHGGAMTFNEGRVILDHVSVRNEEGVNYPVTPEEQYLSFALVSTDSQPLETAAELMLSLVSSSFNYDMKLDEAIVARGDLGYTGKPFEKMRPGGTTRDKPPVAYCIPGARITAPSLVGRHWRMLDYHFQEMASGNIGADGVLVIPDAKSFFAVYLGRKTDAAH